MRARLYRMKWALHILPGSAIGSRATCRCCQPPRHLGARGEVRACQYPSQSVNLAPKSRSSGRCRLNAWHAISADRQTAFCTAAVDGHAVTAAVAIYLDQHPEERNTAAFFLVRRYSQRSFLAKRAPLQLTPR